MRSTILCLLLAASTLTGGVALATPPAPTRSTPPNPDKIIRPTTPAVMTTPKVSRETAILAQKHEQARQDPSKPIPTTFRIAKQEVVDRNRAVTQARVAFRTESAAIESKANALAHPVATFFVKAGDPGARPIRNSSGYQADREIAATPEALAQASETYVSAAQVLVGRSGNLSQRVARENPDQGAKSDAAKEIVVDYKNGAALYRLSADTEDRRAAALTKQGKLQEGDVALDKAHNTRIVAAKFDRKAAEIEARGIPGADAYVLPAEIKLSAK